VPTTTSTAWVCAENFQGQPCTPSSRATADRLSRSPPCSRPPDRLSRGGGTPRSWQQLCPRKPLPALSQAATKGLGFAHQSGELVHPSHPPLFLLLVQGDDFYIDQRHTMVKSFPSGTIFHWKIRNLTGSERFSGSEYLFLNSMQALPARSYLPAAGRPQSWQAAGPQPSSWGRHGSLKRDF